MCVCARESERGRGGSERATERVREGVRTGEISSIWSSLNGGDAPPPIPPRRPPLGGDAGVCVIDSPAEERGRLLDPPTSPLPPGHPFPQL